MMGGKMAWSMVTSGVGTAARKYTSARAIGLATEMAGSVDLSRSVAIAVVRADILRW